MKKVIVTKLILTVGLLLFAAISNAQWSADSSNYTQSGVTYPVLTGERGGKYIVVDGVKKYPSKSAETLTVAKGSTTITYKNTVYPLIAGPKGGLYFVYNGYKKYVKVK